MIILPNFATFCNSKTIFRAKYVKKFTKGVSGGRPVLSGRRRGSACKSKKGGAS
jgi:hypothetical protein